MKRKHPYYSDRGYWFRPAGRYQLQSDQLLPSSKKRQFIIADISAPPSNNRYPLNDIDVQSYMFDMYLNTFDAQSALEFVEIYGLPAGEFRQNSESIQNIFLSAYWLRELLDISDAIAIAINKKDTAELENLIGVVNYQFQFLPTILRYLRLVQPNWAWGYVKYKSNRQTFQQVYSKALAGEKLSDSEANILNMLLAANRFNKNHIFLLPRHVPHVYHSHNGIFSSTTIDPVIMSAQDWAKDKRGCLIYAAQCLLAQAANTMLSGIQPKLKTVWLDNQSLLADAYPVNCPWHCIALEFARRVTKNCVNLRDCPICKESLEGMSPRAKTCTQEKCKKQWQRKRNKLSALSQPELIAIPFLS